MTAALPDPASDDRTLPMAGDAPSAPLTRRQKAAVLVQTLLNAGQTLPLSRLPEGLQSALAEELGRMRPVDAATVAAVMAEFRAEVSAIGLSFPGGLEAAVERLDGSISDTAADGLRRRAGITFNGDPWDKIVEADVARLVPVFERESTEVAAVILSKLKVAKAAELLGLLPGDRARRITYAVSQTGKVSPQAIRTIGISLVRELGKRTVPAFSDGPADRVGAILNSAPSRTRDAVLDGLDQADGSFAEAVRKAIFTFANIPDRLDPRDVPKLIRVADQADLVLALATAEGAEANATEFVLAHMSQRMADNLRAEIEELAGATAAEGEAAMMRIVEAIRVLERDGELVLNARDA